LSPENLYYFKPRYKTNEASRFKNATNMEVSVIENKNFFTKRQIERANSVRRLLHTLGCPTIQDLKTIIRSNAITHCPITIEGISIAEKIYGKDVPSLKGKITRRKSSPVVHDMVEIPSELIEAQQKY
jgi:predicted lactoylglutathione lyase